MDATELTAIVEKASLAGASRVVQALFGNIDNEGLDRPQIEELRARFDSADSPALGGLFAGRGVIRFNIDGQPDQFVTVGGSRVHVSPGDLSRFGFDRLPLVDVPADHWLTALPEIRRPA